jgi:hypothetical protein
VIIELQLVWTPEEMDLEADACGLCGWPVTPRPVIARLADEEGHMEMGVACEECLAYLGTRSRGHRAPTLGEYQRILAEHPRPMFSSAEEMQAAAPPDVDLGVAFYWPSWLWTAEEVRASS